MDRPWLKNGDGGSPAASLRPNQCAYALYPRDDLVVGGDLQAGSIGTNGHRRRQRRASPYIGTDGTNWALCQLRWRFVGLGVSSFSLTQPTAP